MNAVAGTKWIFIVCMTEFQVPTDHQAMTANVISEDRVRKHTASHHNRRIDEEFETIVHLYAQADGDMIARRLRELDHEWDMERSLETNASALALGGTLLGLLVSRKWLVLPMVVTGFLLNHAVRGWCPPVPAMRRAGVRTCREIERERYALMAIRGDFGADLRDPDVLLRTFNGNSGALPES
jgi:hypothetical protein